MPLSTFLNGSTPTQLRGLQWLALSDVGYIVQGTVSDDGGGGGTTVFGTAGTFPCRVDTIGGGEAMAADRMADRSTHLITVPANTAVDVSERFVAAEAGSFEITAVRSATAEMVRTLEAVQL